jgi:hypothetical protein
MIEGTTRQSEESVNITAQQVGPSSRVDIEKPPSIRLDKYDGKSCLETYLAKFRFVSEYFEWTERQQLLYFRTHLEGAAGELLWSHPELTTMDGVIQLLQNRFGIQNQRERFRVELKTRRRKEGENLQTLYQDVVRLMSLAYCNEKSEAAEVIARDTFLEALDDPPFHLRILEREPQTIEDALKIAIRLEAYETVIDSSRAKDYRNVKMKGTVRKMECVDFSASTGSEVGMTQVVSLLKELKEEHTKLRADFESRLKNNSDIADKTTKSIPIEGKKDQRKTMKDKSKDICNRCGQLGHWANRCTTKKSEPLKPTAEGGSKLFMAGTSSAGDETYIKIKVGGIDRCALLDTGCSRSCIAHKFVTGVSLEPPDEKLCAANGTEINTLGAFTLKFKLGNMDTKARLQVSDQLDEMILGIDWLSQNHCKWDFETKKLTIDDQQFCLSARPGRRFVRKVYVAESITLEPHSQRIVPVKMLMHSIRTPGVDWMIDATKMSKGVYSARTMLSGKEQNTGIPVVNFSSKSHTIPEGTLVAQAEMVEVLEVKESEIDNPHVENSLAHIQPIVDALPSDLTEIERQQAINFVQKNSDIFSKSEFDIGRTKLIPHRIDTGANRPVRQQLRRHPRSHLDFIDEQVREMLNHDIIEESASPWCSNVVLVTKKTGKLRFCIDYRKLNMLTYRDSYPVPKIDACLDTLGGAKYFSTLDLRSGYWQVEINEDDRDKTAFVTRMGQFRFKVLPFGLTNAVSVFQRLVDHVLSGLNWFICLCYLDDICVFSNTFEQHMERLTQVIERIKNTGLKFNAEKCKLFQKRIKFLGYEVSERGVEPDAEKVKVILDWPVPRDLTELRSWLGLIGYYRKWITGFSAKAKSLFDLARKGVKFCWEVDQQNSFDELKRCLTSAPVLSLPQDDGEFVLDTDCSNFAAGAVLSQQQNGVLKVIAYASRTLRGAELNYSTTRKELTAIIFGMKQYQQYLLGRHFVLRTDHAALTSLMKTPEVIGQQARYLDYIAQFDFDVVHRSGVSHGNCDSLSRRPSERCCLDENSQESEKQITSPVHSILVTRDGVQGSEMELFFDDLLKDSDNNVELSTDEVGVSEMIDVDRLRRIESRNFISDDDAAVISWDNIAKSQHDDTDLAFVIAVKTRGINPPTEEEMADQSYEVHEICAQWDSLVYTDGMLYRLFEDIRRNTVILQSIIPRQLRSLYVRHCHTGMTGGHQGISKTQEQVARRAYFPSWKQTVINVCRDCEECARYHRGRPPRQGLLQVQEASHVMDRLAVDLTGPHPSSTKGYVYILTAIDVFSRFLVAVPLRNKTAQTVADALYRNVFCKLGTVRQLVTDQGREFDNELLSCLCERFGIKKLRTSTYHPSANGRVERSHRTLNNIIAKLVDENQRNWHEVLDFAIAAYNASPNESTKYSPNFLMFGREVLTPFDLISAKMPEGSSQTINEYVRKLEETMETAYAVVRENTHVAARRRKKIYDATVKVQEFEPKKLVLVFQPRSWRRRSPKWSSYYIGPCLVERRINAVTYVVKRSPKGKSFAVHVDKLKPFRGSTPVQWQKYLEVEIEYPTKASSQLAGPIAVDVRNELAGPIAVDVRNELAGPTTASSQLAGPVTMDKSNQSAGLVAGNTGVTNTFGRQPGAASTLGQPSGRLMKDRSTNRHQRNCYKPKWMQSYVTVIKTRAEHTTALSNMDEDMTRVCHLLNEQGVECKRQFSTDSGIRRHTVTVHGHRYHADRPPSPMEEAEKKHKESIIRLRQQNSRTRKRNARRRMAKKTSGSATRGINQSTTVEMVAAITTSAHMSVTDELSGDWGLTITDVEQSTGVVDLDASDLDSLLRTMDDIFPGVDDDLAAWNLRQPDRLETFGDLAVPVQGLPIDMTTSQEMNVYTAIQTPTTVSTATSTTKTDVRSTGVNTNISEDGLLEVRGYENPLELPERSSISQLFRLLRRFPSTHPDVLARHLARSTYFGRPIGGGEHELVEFALRIMAVTERMIGHELDDVYREVNVVRNADYTRQSFDDFRNGLMSRPVCDAGSALFERLSPVQRVVEESPASPDENAFVISSEGE